MASERALELASSRGEVLVEVSAHADPPVWRLETPGPDGGPKPFTYVYGTKSDFDAGLSGLVSPPEANAQDPQPDPIEHMEREHRERLDSDIVFTTGNYGISTTSEVEFLFVTDPSDDALASVLRPEQSLSSSRFGTWPEETQIDQASHRRRPRPLGDFEETRLAKSAQLKVAAAEALIGDDGRRSGGGTRAPVISIASVIGARLYTGPMCVS